MNDSEGEENVNNVEHQLNSSKSISETKKSLVNSMRDNVILFSSLIAKKTHELFEHSLRAK